MQREVPRHYSEDCRADDFPRQCRELLADLPSGPSIFKDMLSRLLNRLRNDLECTHFALGVFDQPRGVLEVVVHDADFRPLAEIPTLDGFLDAVLAAGEVIQIDDMNDPVNAHRFSDLIAALNLNGLRSLRIVPLCKKSVIFGVLVLSSSCPGPHSSNDTRVLTYTAEALSLLIDNAVMTRQFRRMKTHYATLRDVHEALTSSIVDASKHRVYLEEEIDSPHHFGEVIGKSPPLLEVLKQVQIAAPSDATVLVLGETGTGKELIARALHRLSSRRDGPFIKLNCAAIPTGLLESELFGHEKGSFTGAISQKIGRIELADKGTLFLDEIGEIPMELQPKLLRVLQDQEFERLGGIKTIKVNVRLVAATNRNLAEAVNAKSFRSDLFYRLNVFPIRVPPLRERRGDIRLLVQHFVRKFAGRMGKRVDSISEELIRELQEWHWPGNIRELENFIERSVILTQGPVFYAPMSELRVSSPDRSRMFGTTLEQIEREYILRTLRESGGIVSGATGAAARLGMKRTTLQSRIQKLGINREDYQA